MAALADMFLGARTDAPADAASLEVALGEKLAAGKAAWPDVEVAPEVFVDQIARTLPAAATLADMTGLHGADLYLACACAAGDARALSIFDERILREVDVTAARMKAPPALAVEVKQMLRRILFVSEGNRPAAAGTFGGRGDLRGWVRVAAVRELVRLQDEAKRTVPVDAAFIEVLAPASDPELAYLRNLYKADVEAGLRAAFATTSARDRALLRYQLVEKLSIDQIGAIYGVHRATAARWLEKARAGILERTREELGRRLGIDSAEVDSIIRLVESTVDVTLERAL